MVLLFVIPRYLQAYIVLWKRLRICAIFSLPCAKVIWDTLYEDADVTETFAFAIKDYHEGGLELDWNN